MRACTFTTHPLAKTRKNVEIMMNTILANSLQAGGAAGQWRHLHHFCQKNAKEPEKIGPFPPDLEGM